MFLENRKKILGPSISYIWLFKGPVDSVDGFAVDIDKQFKTQFLKLDKQFKTQFLKFHRSLHSLAPSGCPDISYEGI